jgi:hypothetical protein
MNYVKNLLTTKLPQIAQLNFILNLFSFAGRFNEGEAVPG